jgi:hypothetical protein
VREQVAHGDRSRDSVVGEPQLGEIASDRNVEIEDAALGEAHGRGRRERLRDRTGLENRVLVDRQRVVDARDPELEAVLGAVDEQPDRHSRHAQLRHRLLGDWS